MIGVCSAWTGCLRPNDRKTAAVDDREKVSLWKRGAYIISYKLNIE
jgi:hypothetical protein